MFTCVLPPDSMERTGNEAQEDDAVSRAHVRQGHRCAALAPVPAQIGRSPPVGSMQAASMRSGGSRCTYARNGSRSWGWQGGAGRNIQDLCKGISKQLKWASTHKPPAPELSERHHGRLQCWKSCRPTALCRCWRSCLCHHHSLSLNRASSCCASTHKGTAQAKAFVQVLKSSCAPGLMSLAATLLTSCTCSREPLTHTAPCDQAGCR